MTATQVWSIWSRYRIFPVIDALVHILRDSHWGSDRGKPRSPHQLRNHLQCPFISDKTWNHEQSQWRNMSQIGRKNCLARRKSQYFVVFFQKTWLLWQKGECLARRCIFHIGWLDFFEWVMNGLDTLHIFRVLPDQTMGFFSFFHPLLYPTQLKSRPLSDASTCPIDGVIWYEAWKGNL